MHNKRVDFLDTLAILLGCKESIGGQFPDGKRPDVLRLDNRRGILFIGDGKNTETPGCLDTQVRLTEYFRWMSVHVGSNGRMGIFAICFGRKSDASNWINTIGILAHETGLQFSEFGIERFALGIQVAWFLFKNIHR